jgi:hypothetical protein
MLEEQVLYPEGSDWMRMRHMMASLLAVLLVCSSSWASACALSCQLKQATPVCHSESSSDSEDQGMVMDAAGHCSHMMHASGNRGDVVLLGSCSSCGAMSHGPNTQAFSASDDASSLTDAHHAALTATVIPVPSGFGRYALAPSEAPPGYSSGFQPLLVSLRV